MASKKSQPDDGFAPTSHEDWIEQAKASLGTPEEHAEEQEQ